MRCLGCGTESSRARSFCNACGAALPVGCVRCSIENEPGSRFCAGCGSPLVQGRPVVRKFLTVLFADIDGSTTLIDGLDPEEADRLIEPALDAMVRAVHAYGGTVNRVQGDQVMALFGAPAALEDHAARACLAALRMQSAVREASGGTISIRAGMHSGEVLVRSVHNDYAADYDAVGWVVHAAARVEGLAPPGGVYLTRETATLAAGYIVTRPLGTQRLRGIGQPLEILALESRTPARTRWEARALQGLATFVGRDAELSAMTRALRRTLAGRGQLVSIVGEPGIGKSRLVRQVLESLAAEWTVIESSAARQERGVPYAGLSGIVRFWLGVRDSDGQEQVSAKLRRGMLRNGLDASEHEAPFASLLDLAIRDPSWAQLDPIQRRRRIQATAVSLVRTMQQHGPLILMLEDVHWLDDDTLAAIEQVAAETLASRTLILTTRRPEGHQSAEGPDRSEIRLEPLDDGDAELLLESLMGRSESVRALGRRILDRAAGTPLFIEELVRSMVDQGILGGEPGALELRGDPSQLEQLTIPSSVRAVLAARIDALKSAERAVLQIASVIGVQFGVELLAVLAAEACPDVGEALDALEAARLIDAGRDTRAFSHALVHEVTYEGILVEQRRAFHARLVHELEARFSDRVEENVDRLAEHALRGQLWKPAARYRLRACTRAIARSAAREAVNVFTAGLRALAQMPEGRDTTRAGIDLRIAVLNALIPLGEKELMLRNLREAEALAISLDDARRLALVHSQLSMALWLDGDHAAALTTARSAFDAAQAVASPPIAIGSKFNMGMAYHSLGEFERAIALHEEVLTEISGPLERDRLGWAGYPAAFTRTFLAQSSLELGRYEDAERHLDYGCRFADEMSHPYSQAMIYWTLGNLLLERGSTEEAARVLENTLAIAQDGEVLTMVPAISATLAQAFARLGRLDRASAIVAAALEPDAYRRGGKYTWLYLHRSAAEVHAGLGKHDLALEHAQRAESLSAASGDRAHRAHALRVLAELTSDTAAAGGFYCSARDEALALGMHPLAQRCERELALR